MTRTRSQHPDDDDAPLDMSRLRRVALWGSAAAALLTVAVLIGTSDTGKQRMSFAVASWSKQDRTETRMASAPAPTPAPAPIIIQRDLEAIGEARRLSETVRALSADRDRLQTRLAALERNFEDVTGSIKREISAVRPTPPNQLQASQPPANSLPAIDLPSMTDKPANPPASAPSASMPTSSATSTAPAKTQPLPKIAAAPPPEAEPAPVPAAPSTVPSTPIAVPAFLPPATDPTPVPAPAPPPVVVAAAPPAPPPKTAPPQASPPQIVMAPLDPPLIGGPDSGVPSFGLPGLPALPAHATSDITASTMPNGLTSAATNGATVPRTEFGIDIGSASNMDLLRAQWSLLKQQHPKLLENLQPIVSIRDLKQRRSVELRLVAGPLRNANAAAELCAALSAAGLATCQPAVFDGQKLALR